MNYEFNAYGSTMNYALKIITTQLWVFAILDGDVPWLLLTGKLTIHAHIMLDPLLKYIGH